LFVDLLNISLIAGKGGDGSSSLKRLPKRKFLNDGGDGGKGGDITLKADNNIFDLSFLKIKHTFRSENGFCGGSNNCTGKDAEDSVLKLPLGTRVVDKNKHLIVDLVNKDQELLICRGGIGGLGNFKREESTPGFPGEERDVIFDLRLMADVGVVGFTNTGKSSFLSKVSNVKDKVSEFPFFTKSPFLASVKASKVFTIMELPAIISKNQHKAIFGERFIKHLLRTKLVLIFLDATSDIDQDYKYILSVLEEYKAEYFQDQFILPVINKIDLNPEAKLEGIFHKTISSLNGQGVDELLSFCETKCYEQKKDDSC